MVRTRAVSRSVGDTLQAWHDPRPACGGSARRIASPGTRRRRGGQITTPQIARGHCQVNGKYTLGTHQPGEPYRGIPAAARTRSPSVPDAAAIRNARPVPPPAQVHGRFRFTTFSRTKFRYSRATAINDLDPGQPVPGPDLTVSPGLREPLCRTLLPNSSLTSSTASSPHGWPGPGGHTGMHARLGGARQARKRPPAWPVRGRP